MTSITLAAVVDLEAASTVRGRETQRETQADSTPSRRRRSRDDAPVDTVILFGEPVHALQHLAAEHGYELIVAGAVRASAHLGGRGAARKLATRSPVPVLVGPVSVVTNRCATARDHP